MYLMARSPASEHIWLCPKVERAFAGPCGLFHAEDRFKAERLGTAINEQLDSAESGRAMLG